MFSYHIFLFPFSWERKAESDSSGNQASDIQQFSEVKEQKWVAQTDKTEPNEKALNYNEHKYFHQFAHSAIFEDKINPANTLVRQFEYTAAVGWTYKITINRRNRPPENESIFFDEIPKPPDNYTFKEDQNFILTIKKVTLDLYTQGVGIFAFHLENSTYRKPEEILLINQFGRRIFPPFLDNHYRDFKRDGIQQHIDGTLFREMPCSISLEGSSISIVEDFKETFKHGNFKLDAYIPKHIQHFFEPEWGLVPISPILDDRMFVISWYGAEQLTYDYRKKRHTPKEERKKDGFGFVLSDLCQRMRGGYEVSGFYRNDLQHRSLSLNQTHDSYGYASNDFWYQYVFVDGFGASCANSLLRTEQIEKHTYSRWVENNTLFGITRYSFVCITEPQNILEKPFPNAGFIIDHIQTIYFRMISLVLAQRAMVLKYSEDSIEISKRLKDYNKKTEKEQNKTMDLSLIHI